MDLNYKTMVIAKITWEHLHTLRKVPTDAREYHHHEPAHDFRSQLIGG